jgi:hypothetical protein
LGGIGRRVMVQAQLAGKNTRPYLKNKLKWKKARVMAQVVEHLPSKY